MPISLLGKSKSLTSRLTPGARSSVPFARVLAGWGIVQDFRTSKVMFLDGPKNKLASIGAIRQGT